MSTPAAPPQETEHPWWSQIEETDEEIENADTHLGVFCPLEEDSLTYHDPLEEVGDNEVSQPDVDGHIDLVALLLSSEKDDEETNAVAVPSPTPNKLDADYRGM